MANADIARQRMHNQHISHSEFQKPEDEVRWLGAVQAQEYAVAKWGLGLRLHNASDNDIEQAFTDGAILRTHLMRPTWHFVAREDIRWMLDLTAPRVHALNAPYYRKVELDAAMFVRCNDTLAEALEGGTQLTRHALRASLEQAGVVTKGDLRMGYIMMRAELDGIVCSGARQGKQFTYALLDERAPRTKTLARDEALGMLVTRFFMSHGPATPQDFAKWSGLTVADAKKGLADLTSLFVHETVDGRDYWFPPVADPASPASPTAHLLPVYDEYTIGYKNHDAVFDHSKLSNLVFQNMLIIDGLVEGTWKRTLKKDGVFIETDSFSPLTKARQKAVQAAAQRYGEFLGLPVILA